jgi:hypothetical protein
LHGTAALTSQQASRPRYTAAALREGACRSAAVITFQ